MRIRTILAAGLVTLFGAGIAIGAVGTASAATVSADTCKSGEFCVYENVNFTGGVYHFRGSYAYYPKTLKFSNGKLVDRNISSVVNRTNVRAKLCPAKLYEGSCLVIKSGAARKNLGAHNDEARSHYLGTR